MIEQQVMQHVPNYLRGYDIGFRINTLKPKRLNCGFRISTLNPKLLNASTTPRDSLVVYNLPKSLVLIVKASVLPFAPNGAYFIRPPAPKHPKIPDTPRIDTQV